MIDDRFFWEQTSDYWDLPFYSELGFTPLPDRDDALAAREALWAIREKCDADLLVEDEKLKIEGERK